jgi:hypothetical protein
VARRRKTESLGDGLGRAFTKRGPKVELDFLLPTRGPSAGAEPVLEPAPAPVVLAAPAPEGFRPAPMPAPAPDAPVFEAQALESGARGAAIDPLEPDLTVSGPSGRGLAVLEVDEPTLELWLVEAAPTPPPRLHPVPLPTIVWPSLEASVQLLPVPPPEAVAAPAWTPPRWTPAAPPHPTRWRDRALRHVERLVSRVLRAVLD